jgi:asparagine synthase (glutamine-hydrolysing)
MCGIAGIVALRPGDRPDDAAVAAMADALAHRGPDGQGLWTSPSGRACFAHRRLSVIDLATGGQPFVGAEDRTGLVFNGEIYNYLELRRALEAEGVGFRTQSDTEVLAAVLARDGSAGLAKLAGMFAFASWDEAAGRLTLARDRIGKKPLYYHDDGRFLAFSSSLAALRKAVPHTPEIDPAAVEAYLSLGYVPAPLTILKGFRKLRAAECIEIADGQAKASTFWSLADEPAPFEGGFEEALDHLDGLLERSIALRLRSDVPLGVYLSGGIDSSLVAAAAARQVDGPLQTFSIGFGEAGFDESGHAAAVAQRLGTKHHAFRAEADLLGLLPKLAHHFGEPFADSSALPMWLLAAETRRSVTVALSGDGGDEGFAGYNWYAAADGLRRASGWVPPKVAAAGAGLLHAAPLRRSRVFGRAGRALAMLGAGDAASRFQRQRALFSPEDLRLIRGPSLARPATPAEPVAAAYRRTSGSALRRMRRADLSTYLADGLMPKADVTSMAHGLELRAPLLDHTIVRFGLALPDALHRDAHGGKRLLRALLARYLPGHDFVRPKQGFSVPVSAWFGDGFDDRLSGLVQGPLTTSGLLSPDGVEGLLAEHRAGRRDHGERLFALLMLEEWLRAEGREAAA